MNLVQLVGPVKLPLSLDEVKAQSRVLNNSAEDELIDSYLRAATDKVESIMKRSLMPQSWRLHLDRFPVCEIASCRNYGGYYGSGGYGSTYADYMHIVPSGFCEHAAIKLPRPPIVSVDSFTYTDTAGATITMAETTDYVTSLTNNPPRIVPPFGQSWPAHREYFDSIKIDFTAGYDGAPGREVKDCMLQAIRLLTATYYENRESLTAGGELVDLPASTTVNAILNRYIAWSI